MAANRRWLAFVFLMVTSTIAHGADFRIETDVFVGSKKEPTVQYLTLFAGDVAYDFRITAPEEITIFDMTRNRIVLLDPAQKTKATVTTDELLQYSAAIKAHAEETNATFYFAANPSFEPSQDDSGEWLTLNGKLMTYRIKGAAPKQSTAVRRYQEFADWSARLNAARPGNLPPFARISVNKAVAEKGWIPEEVERSIAPAKLGQRKLDMRSRHLTNWILSETDRKRIERVGDNLISFTAIGFPEYRAAAMAQSSESKK